MTSIAVSLEDCKAKSLEDTGIDLCPEGLYEMSHSGTLTIR